LAGTLLVNQPAGTIGSTYARPVPYWTLVSRSFAIAWRHKYLWLLALFAGEGGGGASFNSSTSTRSSTQNGQSPDFRSAYDSAGSWLNSHIWLIVVVTIAVLLVWIALFVLAAVCEGATVRGAAEHDAERPFGLGWAWRAGRASMGTIIRIRLLLFALVLPVGIVLIVIVAGFIAALASGNGGAAVGLGLLGGLLGLASIVYFIYLDVLGRLSVRAAVLEQVASARAALGRGHRLVVTRLGRVLLVWLLGVGVGIVIGIATALALLLIAVPLFIAGFAAAHAGSAALVVVILLSVLILIPILLLVAGFVAAQGSAYWTLAFRRLDLDAPRTVYPFASPPPSPAAP
jgi:hypothetical protein